MTLFTPLVDWYGSKNLFLKIFYWSTVDLQCCVSFCCTAKWISYTYISIHSFSDSFPVYVIAEYWVEFPVLYNRFFYLFIYVFMYVCMYVCMYLFIYLFMAALGLRCCVRASNCGGFSCCGALALRAWASVVVARGLQSAGSVVVVHGLHCSVACGIFPDQGSNLCPLHWQADSQPLCHQGSPIGSYCYPFYI